MILTKRIEGRRLYLYTKKNGWFLVVTCILAILSTFIVDISFFKSFSLPAGIIVWSINKHLRKIEWEETLSPFIEPEEFEELKSKQHIPYALLTNQTKDINGLFNQNYFSDHKHVSLISNMEHFSNALGKSERIKNTVFPMQYNWYIQYALWIFLIILPFSIVSQFGYWSFPISMAVGYIFILLEYLGRQIENPFENHPSDTPIDSLSRIVEINLKEVLGEKNLPPNVAPREGKFLF